MSVADATTATGAIVLVVSVLLWIAASDRQANGRQRESRESGAWIMLAVGVTLILVSIWMRV